MRTFRPLVGLCSHARMDTYKILSECTTVQPQKDQFLALKSNICVKELPYVTWWFSLCRRPSLVVASCSLLLAYPPVGERASSQKWARPVDGESVLPETASGSAEEVVLGTAAVATVAGTADDDECATLRLTRRGLEGSHGLLEDESVQKWLAHYFVESQVLVDFLVQCWETSLLDFEIVGEDKKIGSHSASH